MSGLYTVRSGTGPKVLFVHGSAADHATWGIQLATLKTKLEMIAYDRRSTPSVEREAADAATLADEHTVVCGSSYGAVVALELARTEKIAGLVLIEPPMARADDAQVAAADFLADFDRALAEEGGPAAAELFLRTVLGSTAFERMPKTYRSRATAKFAEIRRDSAALIAYRPRYAELAKLDVPVLLLGGETSAPYFRPTLDALAMTLPRARREIVKGAGHMLHAEASRKFAELLVGFAASCVVA